MRRHLAPIVQHPRCPPPVFAEVSPEAMTNLRRVMGQQSLHKLVRHQHPAAIALADRVLHLAMEFGAEDLHRWLRTSACIELGDALPCEEQAERSAS